jgi:hypothetical protein
MKLKKIFLALVIALPCFTVSAARPKDDYYDKKKQKQSALADITYTALGLGCLVGAYIAGTKAVEAYKSCDDSLSSKFSRMLDNLGSLLSEEEYNQYLPQAKTAGWGLGTAVLGIAGIQFIAKGMHLKK